MDTCASWRRFILNACFAIAFVAGTSIYLSADEIQVPSQFSTIQEAIYNSEENDVVTVAPGEYPETLEINHPITLRAASPGTVLISPEQTTDPVITIASTTGVSIEGLTIEGGLNGIRVESGSLQAVNLTLVSQFGPAILSIRSEISVLNSNIGPSMDIGIAVKDGSTAFIEQNTLTQTSWAGIDVSTSTDIRIINNTIINTQPLRGLFGQGISIRNGSSARISGNTIMGSAETGVVVKMFSDAVIDANTISDNRFYGVFIDTHAIADISNNTIIENEISNVSVQLYSNATIADNQISTAQTSSEGNFGRGIEIFDNAKAIISGNTIAQNATIGIIVLRSSDAEIHNNNIIGNLGNGIRLIQSSARIESNMVQNNVQGILVQLNSSGDVSDNIVDGNIGFGINIFDSNMIVSGNSSQNTQLDSEGFGRGIQIVNSSSTIQGNSVSGNSERGVAIFDSNDFRLESNTIQNNDGFGGILIVNSRGELAENQILSNLGSGLNIFDSNLLLEENTISRTRMDAEGFAGGIFAGSSVLVLSNNTIEDNEQLGISLFNESSAELRNNIIRNNANFGVVVDDSSLISVCESNEITGHSQNLAGNIPIECFF